MGYTAQCDAEDCNERCSPMLLAQFSPEKMRTSQAGGFLSDNGYSEGDTVTLCEDCTLQLLAGIGYE